MYICIHVQKQDGELRLFDINTTLASGSSKQVEIPTVYKHLVLLVRGVAGLLRVTPGYRVFRNCQQSRTVNAPSEIRYAFTVSFPSSLDFPPSCPTTEFNFNPVTSPFGSLSVSVVYRNDCSMEVCLCERKCKN